MSPRAPEWLAIFESIHHVLAAERLLVEKGIWCDLLPTPRHLSSNCGMCLEFREADRDVVEPLLKRPELRMRGLHPGESKGG